MAMYFFHVTDGHEVLDLEGCDFLDVHEACQQAMRATGETLRDRHTLAAGATWQMRVSDSGGDTICRLLLSAR